MRDNVLNFPKADAEITEENFSKDRKHGGGRVQAFFDQGLADPVTFKSDFWDDLEANKYETDEERRRGDAAMAAWFEYVYSKPMPNKARYWVHLMRNGGVITVPHPDPGMFDPMWVPPVHSPLGRNFFDSVYARRRPPAEDMPAYREKMMRRWGKLQSDLRYAADPCTPRTCQRKYGQPCQNEGLRACRSHDAAPMREAAE